LLAARAQYAKRPKGAHSRRSPTIGEVAAKAATNLQNLTVAELTSLKRFQALQQQIKDTLRAALRDSDPYLFNRDQVAEIFRVHVRTITRWAKKGRLPESKNRKWDIREVIRVLLSTPGDADLAPDERSHIARARLLELKAATLASELISRNAVLRMIGPVLSALRSSILGIPDRLLQMIPVSQRQDARKELDDMATAALKEIKEAFQHAAGT